MNASWPRWTRITDSGLSRSTGMMRSRTASKYSTRSPFVALAPSKSESSRLVRGTPARDSLLGALIPPSLARRRLPRPPGRESGFLLDVHPLAPPGGSLEEGCEEGLRSPNEPVADLADV